MLQRNYPFRFVPAVSRWLEEMSSSKGRLILSWIVGIIIFGILHYLLEEVASFLGFKISFYFEGFEYDQYVETDKSTSLGWFLILIEIIIASRIGMAINYGNFKDGTGEHTNLLLLVTTTCYGAYALFNTAIWELFEREIERNVSPFLYNIMDFGVMVGIGYLGYIFYQNKTYSEKEDFLEPFIFRRVQSEDGDHFLEKKDSLFFLGYDNHKDLRMWKFALPTSISEQKLTEMFFEKTGRGAGRFDFDKWLNEQGVVLEEHGWY